MHSQRLLSVNAFIYIEQTTHDVASIISEMPIREKNYLPNSRGSFFLFLGCISYATLVNIIPLSGTHTKREPLVGKGSSRGTLHELCSFLYILDVKGFRRRIS